MKPLSELAPGLLVIQIQIQAVCLVLKNGGCGIIKTDSTLSDWPVSITCASIVMHRESVTISRHQLINQHHSGYVISNGSKVYTV